ncbi:hypothetical protein SIPHO037v1_p0023 [Vibrio phage 70E35.2]|nr:hypothetical protein SIPHO037v1_p0023 [Vibrio phage 70E35.2]
MFIHRRESNPKSAGCPKQRQVTNFSNISPAILGHIFKEI